MPHTAALEDDGWFLIVGWFQGIGHPPGYPLQTLISSLFLKLPWGSPALLGHLLSGIPDLIERTAPLREPAERDYCALNGMASVLAKFGNAGQLEQAIRWLEMAAGGWGRRDRVLPEVPRHHAASGRSRRAASGADRPASD